MQESYISSFSIHGLTKTFIGNPGEKVFWTVILVAAACFIGFMCYGNYNNYLAKNVRTEVRVQLDNEIALPVIHICNEFWLNSFDCYKNASILKGYYRKRHCNIVKMPKIWCFDAYQSSEPLLKSCAIEKIIPGCLSLNVNYSLTTQMGKGVHILVESDYLQVFFDPEDTAHLATDVLLNKNINTGAGNRIYEVYMQKKIIKRQPIPYPSKCSNGKGIENFFTSTYSREACFQSCYLRQMLKECGTVIDRWQRYIKPEEVHQDYNRNKSDDQTKDCLNNFINYRISNKSDTNCHCPLPCEETRLHMHVNLGRPNFGFRFEFHHYPFETSYETEVPAYPIEQFVADIGGLTGLLCGMSMLSIFEIILFLCISIIVLCKRW